MKSPHCVLVLAWTVLTGCGPATEYSAELTEPGLVYDVAFVPEGHGSDLAVGFDGEGRATVTPVRVTIPARYAIVFKCQHGKFVIDGPKAKELYHRLNRGDEVTIIYREVYRAAGDQYELADLDFIDAVAVSESGPAP